MSEASLKELSERATPGDLSQADWGSDLRAGKTLIGMTSPAPEGNGKANGAYLCRLWNDHRAGRLHDATALAEAEARERRAALGCEAIEAASAAFYDSMIGPEEKFWPHREGWKGKDEPFKAKVRERMRLALEAAALANTTPETRQPETEAERCIACDVPFKTGDRYLPDASGGSVHRACCGPEPESFTHNGEPLSPGAALPEGMVWTDETSGPAGQEVRP